MSKYKALENLGLGLMQWGASHKDRELKREAMQYERQRNERLDALKAREVTAMEGKTKAETDRIAAEAVRLGLENEQMPEKLRAEIADLYAQGRYKDAQARLADASAGKVREETKTVVPESEARVNLMEGQGRAAHATADETEQKVEQQRQIFEEFGMDTAKQEYVGKFLDNKAKQLEAADQQVQTEMRIAKQELDEFIAGAKRDEDGNLVINEKVMKFKAAGKDGQPTKELQIAAALIPALEESYPDMSPDQRMAVAIDLATQMTQRNAVPDAIERMIAAGIKNAEGVTLEPSARTPAQVLGAAKGFTSTTDDEDDDDIGI